MLLYQSMIYAYVTRFNNSDICIYLFSIFQYIATVSCVENTLASKKDQSIYIDNAVLNICALLTNLSTYISLHFDNKTE